MYYQSKVAVYAGTRNLYPYMCAAAKSLLRHSDVDKIYFLIEDDEFPYELPLKTETINISGQTYFAPDGPNYNTSWTYMVLMRAALSKVFPNLDTILSLDVDTIVNRNVSDLWDIPLGNNYIAAAKEPCKSTKDFTSINMGVALLNLKKLREDGMDDKIINALNTKHYDYPEQDCISELCKGHIYVLSPNYNVQNWADMENITDRKISHFAAIKNWKELPIVKWYLDLKNDEYGLNLEDDFGLDIIIPAYNDLKGLRRTLDSIDCYYDFIADGVVEITVVDDCSTVDYTEIMREYPYVNFMFNSENEGPGVARETGIFSTIKPFFMFVDCGDIIVSKYAIYEILDVLKNKNYADLYQWPWINDEWHTVSVKNSTCTPGLVYRREFIDLHDIRFNMTPEGSYSNEDVGFNHTAKAIMRQYESWDECPHYIWNEMPVYKMIVNENSLTHKNKGEYYQTKHIRGLASNAAHCIKQLDANNIEDEILLFELNTFMVALYYDYLNCSKKYPKCSEENLKQVKDFYNNVYRKYENRPLNSTYQGMALSQKMKPLMKLGVQVNLKRFLRGLKF